MNCETQEEVDELWEKLSAGGEQGPCGWLKDKYTVLSLMTDDVVFMVPGREPFGKEAFEATSLYRADDDSTRRQQACTPLRLHAHDPA